MVLLHNNDETIHIHSMFPCRRGASKPPHELVAHCWGLGDVRHDELESVSP